MILILASGQQLRGDLIVSAVLRNDLAPVPVTLEADIRADDEMDRELAEGKLITAGTGDALRIIKSTKTVARAVQGGRTMAVISIVAVLDACHQACFVRERPILKENTSLAAIYRAAGANVRAIDADFQAKRFTCLVGDTPTYPIARLLQEEGGVVRWKGGRLKFFRVGDLLSQKPVLDLPDNGSDTVTSGFLERHEVPWFYSVDESGAFVYGNRGKARNAVFVPNADERALRNMTRCIVRRKTARINLSINLCAGDVINFAGADPLVIITAAHVFVGDGGTSETYSRLWLGSVEGT